MGVSNMVVMLQSCDGSHLDVKKVTKASVIQINLPDVDIAQG